MTVITPDQKGFYEKALVDLANRIRLAKHLVIFTGAGISTDSGLPDYRGADGIWTRKHKGLSAKKIKPFSKFKPNNGHKALYELYHMGYLKFLITQNIDNLHRRSGIPESNLAEIHGNFNRLRCINCDKRFELKNLGLNNNLQSLSDPIAGTKVEKNCSCGGKIIPTYVNFGRPLLDKELQSANGHASNCDLFIAIGTTLSVEPGSILPKKAKNNNAFVVIINNTRTNYDLKADIIIHGQIEIILPTLVKYVKKKHK